MLINMQTGLLILMIFLSALLFAVVFFTVWSLIEPHILEISKIKLFPSDKNGEFKKPAPRTSYAGAAGLRLFFFSDLHAELCMIKPERLISAIKDANNEQPLDAVVFGGDICNSYQDNSKGLPYLKKIADTCSELNIPFYGVKGNHDVNFDSSDRKCFYQSIEGDQIRFTSHSTGKPVILCGVEDAGKDNTLWNPIPAVPSDCVSILVCHNPDHILFLNESDHVDFMLSGHFHAGQLKLPYHLEFVKLRSGILPRRNVVEGVFEHKGITLFISRGLGCNALPIRFRAIPEVSVLEICV